MRPIWFLFSFEGRIGRESYWLFLAACFGLSIVLQFAVGTPTEGQAMVFWLALLWPVLAVIVKRYHDRNKSGLWALVHILIPPLGIIECGFLRGSAGTNRFGADVLPQTLEGHSTESIYRRWFQLLVGAGLFIFGLFFLSSVLFVPNLDAAERIWGTVIGIAAWWGAYSFAKRGLTRRLTTGRTDGPERS